MCTQSIFDHWIRRDRSGCVHETKTVREMLPFKFTHHSSHRPLLAPLKKPFWTIFCLVFVYSLFFTEINSHLFKFSNCNALIRWIVDAKLKKKIEKEMKWALDCSRNQNQLNAVQFFPLVVHWRRAIFASAPYHSRNKFIAKIMYLWLRKCFIYTGSSFLAWRPSSIHLHLSNGCDGGVVIANTILSICNSSSGRKY